MENELRDIKPLLEIPDSSYYLYLGLISIGVLLLLGLLFFVIKKFMLNRKESLNRRYLRELKEVNWEDAKTSAYRVTKLGRFLAQEKRAKEIYSQILPLLEQYKYKKEVPTVDDETLMRYNLLVHVIDESI